jgi:ribosomal-protein-alanine N-acetyltransferase
VEVVGTLHTRRLVGERLRPSDLGDLRGLHRDPGVMATLSADGEVAPEGHTREHLRGGLEHWERHGYGTWMFRDRARGGFVGYCGLWNTRVEGREEVELAYAVASGRWGEGFGTEMAREVAALGLGRLGLAGLVARTLPTNRASRRVMEKAGFGYERDTVHAGLPHVLYRLPAPRREGPRERGEAV